jgi:voltage-gated potassium channel
MTPDTNMPKPVVDAQLKRERWRLLRRLGELLDKPMIGLSLVWLLLIIIDFTAGLPRVLEIASYIIWGLFVLDFLIRLIIAPHRRAYLRHNWLLAVSLALPALRVFGLAQTFRMFQVARATRSLSLLRLVTSVNRTVRAVSQLMRRRGLGFVLVLSVVVTFAGAAGMEYFENPAAVAAAGYRTDTGEGFATYGSALWWTGMIMTTMGSEYWPKTAAGRILAYLLALYAFGVSGYVTASIASFFVARDRQERAISGQDAEEHTLTREIMALRREIAALHAVRNRRLPPESSAKG